VLVLLGADEKARWPFLSEYRPCGRVARNRRRLADVIGAASLLISEVALPELVARASGSRRRSDDASQVVIRPVVSEKSFVLARPASTRSGSLTARNKTQIRQAIEELFDVKCSTSAPRSVKSKPKRRGQTSGRSRQWKKAIVQVREGDTIPIFQGLEGPE